MSAKINHAHNKREYGYCAAIRALVFVQEQNCPIHTEFCKQEESYKDYVLYIDNNTPIATARWQMKEKDTAKIGRIAVLKNYRRQGHGTRLVTYITDKISGEKELKRIEMSAQDTALPFYKKLGYEVASEGYIEDNIPHHKIVKHV